MDRRHGKSVSGSLRMGAERAGVLNPHRILACALWLGLAVLVGGLTGCAHRDPMIFEGRFGTVYVAEQSDITAIAHGFQLPKEYEYAGLNWREANWIFCRYHWWFDRPDFWVLGHEVWHDRELGGDFHK